MSNNSKKFSIPDIFAFFGEISRISVNLRSAEISDVAQFHRAVLCF